MTLADPDITPPHGTRTGLRSPSPRTSRDACEPARTQPNPKAQGRSLQSYNLHGTTRRLVVLLLAKLHPIGIPRCASRAATAVVTRLCQPVGLPRRVSCASTVPKKPSTCDMWPLALATCPGHLPWPQTARADKKPHHLAAGALTSSGDCCFALQNLSA